MKFSSLPLAGSYLIEFDRREDHRGSFVKSFHESTFLNSPLATELIFKEDFYSVSKSRVLRGMHFQLPPHAQDKLVFCLLGESPRLKEATYDAWLGSARTF